MADDTLSDEDKALFRDHMRSVKPLNEKTSRVKDPKTPPPVQMSPRRKQIENTEKAYFLSDFITDTVLSNTILSYSRESLPSKRFKALKQGNIPWEVTLDLHGLKADAARQILCDFIQKQTANNRRCVLVIHGKGGHEGAPPVIKNLVNRWLPQLEQVLAFHSALPKDGGYGAVYILLKRNKE